MIFGFGFLKECAVEEKEMIKQAVLVFQKIGLTLLTFASSVFAQQYCFSGVVTKSSFTPASQIFKLGDRVAVKAVVKPETVYCATTFGANNIPSNKACRTGLSITLTSGSHSWANPKSTFNNDLELKQGTESRPVSFGMLGANLYPTAASDQKFDSLYFSFNFTLGGTILDNGKLPSKLPGPDVLKRRPPGASLQDLAKMPGELTHFDVSLNWLGTASFSYEGNDCRNGKQAAPALKASAGLMAANSVPDGQPASASAALAQQYCIDGVFSESSSELFKVGDTVRITAAVNPASTAPICTVSDAQGYCTASRPIVTFKTPSRTWMSTRGVIQINQLGSGSNVSSDFHIDADGLSAPAAKQIDLRLDLRNILQSLIVDKKLPSALPDTAVLSKFEEAFLSDVLDAATHEPIARFRCTGNCGQQAGQRH